MKELYHIIPTKRTRHAETRTQFVGCLTAEIMYLATCRMDHHAGPDILVVNFTLRKASASKLT